MNSKSELESLLEQNGLDSKAARVLMLACPGLHLAKQYKLELAPQKPLFFGLINRKPKSIKQSLKARPCASKIGGIPDVSAGFRWPRWEGKPVAFLAQINCAEIADFTQHTLFPPKGMLYFFFDFFAVQFMKDSSEDEILVLYQNDLNDLHPASIPGERKQTELVLPSFPVEFKLIQTFPHYETDKFKDLQLDDLESDAYFEALDQYSKSYSSNDSLHQIGGYPNCIQGDVRTEFEVDATKNSTDADNTRWDAASRKSDDWKLLFQMDTDDDLNLMWGDLGRLYFCIREADLRSGRFNKARAISQCH